MTQNNKNFPSKTMKNTLKLSNDCLRSTSFNDMVLIALCYIRDDRVRYTPTHEYFVLDVQYR